MVTFRLYGVECHDCGQPASWYSDGVTMPCGCGTPPVMTRDDVITKISNHARAQQATRPVQPEDKATDRELRAWVEIAEVLRELTQKGRAS